MRLILFAVLFFLMPKLLWSQISDFDSAYAHYETSKALYDSSDFKLALQEGQLALEYFDKKLGIRDTMVAFGNIQVSRCFFKLGDYKQAEAYSMKGVTQLLQYHPELKLKIAYGLHALGIAQYRQDKLQNALSHLNLAIVNFDVAEGDNLSKKIISMKMKGRVLFRLGEFEKAALLFEEVLSLRRELYGDDDVKVAYSLIDLGSCYDEFGNYNGALKSYEEALKIMSGKLPEGHKNFGILNDAIAVVYFNQGDFSRALSHFNAAFSIYQAYHGKDHPNLASAYNNLAFCSQKLRNYDQAFNYYQEAVDINLKSFDESHQSLAILYNNIGDLFLEMNKAEQGAEYMKKALEVWKRIGHNTHLGETYYNLGLASLAIGEYEKSIEEFNLSYAHYTKENEVDKIDVAEVYQGLGDAFFKLNQLNESLSYYEKSLAELKYRRTFIDYESVQFPHLVLHGLEKIGNVHLEQYQQTGEEKRLEQSESRFKEALDLLSKTERLYSGVESKELLFRDHFGLFEKMLEVKRLYYVKNPSLATFESAFSVTQASRNLLLSQLNDISAIDGFKGVPESLLLKDKANRRSIIDNEKLKYELEQQDSLNSDSLSVIHQKLLSLGETLDSVNTVFRSEYPRYFEARFLRNFEGLGPIQKALGDQETLLSYFVGEEVIYALIVNQKSYSLAQLPARNLRESVTKFKESIQDYSPLDNDQADVIQSYTTEANRLFLQLIAPIQKQLKSELKIIAGGYLTHIPFDALLIALPEKEALFDLKKYEYLSNEYVISYLNAAQELYAVNAGDESILNGSLAAFAPDYSSTIAVKSGGKEIAFKPLSFNIVEAESVGKILNGKIFTSHQASLTNFRKVVPNYSILHLATHGLANDVTGDFSFLTFSSESEENSCEVLYAKDLYNLNLNAELVTLSACESGLGELQEGEGIIGLARGFTIAGAKSVLTSLWAINDKATARFMELFYSRLEAGEKKNIALHQSKIAYRKTVPNRYAHPKYWSGFKMIGNVEKVDFVNRSMNTFWIYSLLLIPFLFIVRRIFK